MIRAAFAHPLCAILIALLAAPPGFAQNPPPVTQPAPEVLPPAKPKAPGTPLTIVILEGNNATNSVRLLGSVAAAVEVRDSDDFPVEDASVTFTLPAQGTGGIFLQGGKTFSTKSDARGQAIAPAIVPTGMGKFKIFVTATLGDRKGEVAVNQTNSDGAYVGPPVTRSWYKRKLVWAIVGGAAATVLVVVLLRRGSGSGATVVVTPGTPVIAP